MNERFASVWDALPLNDTVEEALLPECRRMADRLGYSLVLTRDWWHLTAVGIHCRFADLADVRQYLRKAIKSPAAALAGAGCTVTLDSPETTLQAVFRVMPIDTSHWTVNAENATRPRDINDGELSNES